MFHLELRIGITLFFFLTSVCLLYIVYISFKDQSNEDSTELILSSILFLTIGFFFGFYGFRIILKLADVFPEFYK